MSGSLTPGPTRMPSRDRRAARRAVVRLALDQQPRSRRARLAGVLEDRVRDALRREVQSASANTMFGDLPPSSMTTGTTLSAAIFATATPTSTDPVNVS
jgi:hypothetical protein